MGSIAWVMPQKEYTSPMRLSLSGRHKRNYIYMTTTISPCSINKSIGQRRFLLVFVGFFFAPCKFTQLTEA